MTNSNAQAIPCPVCQRDLEIRNATGRKSGKPFLMFICPEDGRHFRGFINDRGFMQQVLKKLRPEPGQGSAA